MNLVLTIASVLTLLTLSEAFAPLASLAKFAGVNFPSEVETGTKTKVEQSPVKDIKLKSPVDDLDLTLQIVMKPTEDEVDESRYQPPMVMNAEESRFGLTQPIGRANIPLMPKSNPTTKSTLPFDKDDVVKQSVIEEVQNVAPAQPTIEEAKQPPAFEEPEMFQDSQMFQSSPLSTTTITGKNDDAIKLAYEESDKAYAEYRDQFESQVEANQQYYNDLGVSVVYHVHEHLHRHVHEHHHTHTHQHKKKKNE